MKRKYSIFMIAMMTAVSLGLAGCGSGADSGSGSAAGSESSSGTGEESIVETESQESGSGTGEESIGETVSQESSAVDSESGSGTDAESIVETVSKESSEAGTESSSAIILEISNGSASRDGVTVTLDKATAERKSKPDRYQYTLSGKIENTSDEGIMKVIYTFALCDENGEEFRSFGIVYDGEDEAIPPHTSVDFYHDDVRWGPQSVPASVSIGIGSVKTEKELPPEHVPKKGEYLYEAVNSKNLNNIKEKSPVAMAFHIDQGGYGRTAVFEEGASLDKAVDLFCGIRIGEETNEWVTDNYNWISLTWEDGTTTYISLNLYNLEYNIHSSPHMYELEHLDEFWSYASGYLSED